MTCPLHGSILNVAEPVRRKTCCWSRSGFFQENCAQDCKAGNPPEVVCQRTKSWPQDFLELSRARLDLYIRVRVIIKNNKPETLSQGKDRDEASRQEIEDKMRERAIPFILGQCINPGPFSLPLLSWCLLILTLSLCPLSSRQLSIFLAFVFDLGRTFCPWLRSMNYIFASLYGRQEVSLSLSVVWLSYSLRLGVVCCVLACVSPCVVLWGSCVVFLCCVARCCVVVWCVLRSGLVWSGLVWFLSCSWS
jgi:hypothetical protein